MSRHLADFEDYTDLEEDNIDFDVVIVGGGLSGLTAGNRLISAGLDVAILEQTDSIGGRLLSNKESESFYAHELQGRLSAMMQSLKISKRRQKYPNVNKTIHFAKYKILNDSLPFYVAGEIHYFIKTVDAVSKRVNVKTYNQEETNEQFSNASVEDLLCRLVFFEKSRSICRNLIYITCGITHLDKISALWYLAMLSGAGGFLQRLRVNLGDTNRYFINGGAINIAQLLSKHIKKDNHIYYNEHVYKIQFNDDRAHVWTDERHYKCNYVVIAAPPTQCSRIYIEPHLPAALKKAQLSFEQGRNIFFNGLFSPSHGFDVITKNVVGSANSKINLSLAYDATCSDDKRIHISGLFSKPNIDPVIRNNFISMMNRYFSNNTMQFEDYTEKDWKSNTGGSPMEVLMPGSLRCHINLLSETHGRVFFAASEYASKWPGTVDGAIEAGESTACSVLQLIRPQSINRSEWILYKYLSLIILELSYALLKLGCSFEMH